MKLWRVFLSWFVVLCFAVKATDLAWLDMQKDLLIWVISLPLLFLADAVRVTIKYVRFKHGNQ